MENMHSDGWGLLFCALRLFCRNSRARSFHSRYTRCNMCIASGPHVYVSFIQEPIQHGALNTGRDCTLTAGPQNSPNSSLGYVRPAVYAAEPPELGWARDR
jgi:hypothetical protein